MKIKVRVKPNSGKQEVVEKDDFYLVCLKSSPENGKANIELRKILEKYFKKEIKIISGFSSRKKIVGVMG